MTEIALTADLFIIAFFTVLYIILMSISMGKYHQCLSRIKKNKTRLRLQMISETDLQKSIEVERIRVKKLKTLSFMYLTLIGVSHILISVYQNSLIITAGVMFLIFVLILFVNYWLKGNDVTRSIKSKPGQSDFRPL